MVKARAGSTLTTFKGDLDDIRNSLRTRAMLAKP
jgi:hypothetical protein